MTDDDIERYTSNQYRGLGNCATVFPSSAPRIVLVLVLLLESGFYAFNRVSSNDTKYNLIDDCATNHTILWACCRYSFPENSSAIFVGLPLSWLSLIERHGSGLSRYRFYVCFQTHPCLFTYHPLIFGLVALFVRGHETKIKDSDPDELLYAVHLTVYGELEFCSRWVEEK